MNLRAQGVVNVGAGAVLIGGVLLVAFPQFGASIVQLVLMTVAAAAGLSALLVVVPEWGGGRWWDSPFRTHAVAVHDGEDEDARELERLRTMFAGRRHPVAEEWYLPPDLVRVLRRLIRAALERDGIDGADPARRTAAVRRLSPLSRAVLDHDLGIHRPWYRTRRPAPDRVADLAHQILDDLASL